MVLLLTFLLGSANFAMHAAVLESGHELVRQPIFSRRVLGVRLTILLEFALLLGALLLVANDLFVWGWVYFGYTLCNGVAAWLILSRRV